MTAAAMPPPSVSAPSSMTVRPVSVPAWHGSPKAEEEGRLGEIEGLVVSLADAQDTLTQLDAEQKRRGRVVDIGMPAFRDSTSTLPIG
ncbi:hypothetical protein ABT173_35240 [Streptomyces sp. NPDC001795]|uniref:hypothetical protein n=1 Tax=Streptomyces sp. NPDC001795 TaxID=3154525 RepID=UPI00331D44F1